MQGTVICPNYLSLPMTAYRTPDCLYPFLEKRSLSSLQLCQIASSLVAILCFFMSWKSDCSCNKGVFILQSLYSFPKFFCVAQLKDKMLQCILCNTQVYARLSTYLKQIPIVIFFFFVTSSNWSTLKPIFFWACLKTSRDTW